MSRYDEGITDYVLKDMTEVVRMDSGTRMVENNSSMFLVNISHCPTATLEELEGLEQVKSQKDQGSLIHKGNRHRCSRIMIGLIKMHVKNYF